MSHFGLRSFCCPEHRQQWRLVVPPWGATSQAASLGPGSAGLRGSSPGVAGTGALGCQANMHEPASPVSADGIAWTPLGVTTASGQMLALPGGFGANVPGGFSHGENAIQMTPDCQAPAQRLRAAGTADCAEGCDALAMATGRPPGGRECHTQLSKTYCSAPRRWPRPGHERDWSHRDLVSALTGAEFFCPSGLTCRQVYE